MLVAPDICIDEMIIPVLSGTIRNLDIVLKKFLRKEFSGMKTELQWTNLAVQYHHAIEKVLFALEEHELVMNMGIKAQRAWARRAMMPASLQGLDFWLDQYHKMMTGEDHLRPAKPLLAIYMETRFVDKCDDNYISDIENLWKLTQTTQVRGHLALLDAQVLMAENANIIPVNVSQVFDDRIRIQMEEIGKFFCPTFNITNTDMNLEKCETSNLGFGLIQNFKPLELKCRELHYPTSAKVSCPSEGQPQDAQCLPCNCDEHGSLSINCTKIQGQCQCKDGFGGRTCSECFPGFYGDDCQPCECNEDGIWGGTTCDPTTGQCECYDGFTGLNCDGCLDDYFGDGCYWCDCYEDGTLPGTLCDPTSGQCQCKVGFADRRCWSCDTGYEGDSCEQYVGP